MNLAYLETRMGLYKSSYKKCTDLLTFMKESGYSQITKAETSYAGLYSCLAGIDCMRTYFDYALENIKTEYSLCKNESNNSFKVVVLLVYSLTLYGGVDRAGAIMMLKEAEDIIKLNKIAPGAMAIYIAMKRLILIEQNQLDSANDFFKENGLEYDKKISYSDEYGYVPYALLLIIELKFEEAEILLSKLFKMAQAENRIERIVELKVLYAILNKTTGNKEEAIADLIESMEYAANDSIIMAFIFHLDKIDDLLKEVFRIQAASKTKIPKQLIDKLKLAIGKREKLKKNRLDAELSARELDILQLLAGDFSNKQIADKLFISLNTVKTHVSNIRLKLEVNNRLKAVIKAKKLGII
jgi:LuxR family maltose regulon positive regulatory protein